MTADISTAIAWLALGLLGFLAGVIQRRGRDYFPANMLLGLCIGVPGVYWLFWYARFGGDLDALRAWSGPAHAALWLYAAEVALAAWALFLAVRVNLGRAGSSANYAGQLTSPTHEMIDGALEIIERADRHRLYTKAQRQTRTRLIKDLADAALDESARARAYNEYKAREREAARARGDD